MHIVLEDSGVNWVPADGQRLFVDAGAGCLHTVEGRLVTSLQLPKAEDGAAEQEGTIELGHGPSPSPQSSSSMTVRAGLVSAGPVVRAMLSSLDGSMTALRRGGRQLEIFDHSTGNLFVEAPGAAEPGKSGRRDVNLLGFFWVENEKREPRLVMVTPLGLELYDLQPGRQGLRAPLTLPVPDTQWHLYDSNCRIAILGFGPGGSRLQPVLFPPGTGTTAKLPMIDLGPPWASSPVRSVDSPDPEAQRDPQSLAPSKRKSSIIGPSCVWLVMLYGRIYLAFHDVSSGTLRLYRLYRDASSLVREYVLPGPARRIALSVIDNVLAVHLIETHVSLLYDLAIPGFEPLCSPLPIGGAGRSEHGVEPLLQGDAHEEEPMGAGAQEPDDLDPTTLSHGASNSQDNPPPTTPSSSLNALQLYMPDWALDASQGVVYRLTLDLEEMAKSSSGWELPGLLSFLRRRNPSGIPSRDAQAISIRLLQEAICDGRSLAEIRAGFDAVAPTMVSSVAKPMSKPRQQTTPPKASPRESVSSAMLGKLAMETASVHSTSTTNWRPIYGLRLAPGIGGIPSNVLSAQLFNPLFGGNQMVNPDRLLACLLECLASWECSRAESIDPGWGLLVRKILHKQNALHRLRRLLADHPSLISSDLVSQILADVPGGSSMQLAAPDTATVSWAVQLYVQAGVLDQAVKTLLQFGRIEEAARLAKRLKITTVNPGDILDAASASGNLALLTAVYRLCAVHAQPAVPQLPVVLLNARANYPDVWR